LSNSKQFASQIRKPTWNLRPQFFFLKHFSFWEELSKIWSKTFTDLYVKYRLSFINNINKTRIFSKDFQKIFKYQILWNFVEWGLCFSMLTDRQADGLVVGWTDRLDETTVRISQFCERAYKWVIKWCNYAILHLFLIANFWISS
jgi:hypothetical protein